jgi:D-arabinose 1-dehydrogenase-like Zn-dependent alcohol dehydrogenase
VKADASELELVGIALEAAQPSGAAVGRVDDAPEGAAVLLGKRVLIAPRDACGQCEVCRRGGAAVCPFATARGDAGRPRLRAATRWLVALGNGLDLPVPAAAAVAGDVTAAYTLYARTGLSPREPVVIVGTTAVTRFLVEILRAKAITPVVVVDDAAPAGWREWLLGKGAAAVGGDAAALAPAVNVTIAAQGQGTKPLRLIATDPAALPIALSLAGPRASLTVLAGEGSTIPPLAGELFAREVTVIGVAGPHPDLVVEAAAMCVKGEIDLVAGTDASDGTDPTRARVRTIA